MFFAVFSVPDVLEHDDVPLLLRHVRGSRIPPAQVEAGEWLPGLDSLVGYRPAGYNRDIQPCKPDYASVLGLI